jgi:hypothetical protein
VALSRERCAGAGGTTSSTRGRATTNGCPLHNVFKQCMMMLQTQYHVHIRILLQQQAAQLVTDLLLCKPVLSILFASLQNASLIKACCQIGTIERGHSLHSPGMFNNRQLFPCILSLFGLVCG